MRGPLKIIQSRELRKNLTDAEQALWHALRYRQILGFKFRRQHVIGPYICDFVCSEKMLVIEVDGGQHQAALAYDNRRDTFIRLQGFKVIRFWNHDVWLNRDLVLEVIYRHLESDATEPPP